MAVSLLILVSSDPRTSGRPAEAIRFAAGVAAWQKVSISLYLEGPALLSLQEETFDFVDGQNFADYLPRLQELKAPIYVPLECPHPGVQPVSVDELSRIAASAQYVFHL